jgi:capsular polysaccharide biosynthesis protein
LTRDYETAHTIYDNLLTNESAAQVQAEMERKQQGEQVKLLDPATLPDSPSFPVRWMFALVGFGVGLGLGACVAFWQELRDKSIRDEGDVLAALELPTLASVPWPGAKVEDGKARRSFRQRIKPFSGERKTA